MQAMTAESVDHALDGGTMAIMAGKLTPMQRVAIAEYVTGKKIGSLVAADAAADAGRCPGDSPPLSQTLDGAGWNGWGNGLGNARFQAASRITPESVSRLRLEWAFGIAGAVNANAQPSIVGGWLFVGGGDRLVHALDARTGCTHWRFPTEAPVRAAIVIGKLAGSGAPIAWFGDTRANVYAVDAATGTLLWRTKLDDHPAARITGGPALFRNVVYFPVSSIEEGTGARSDYGCCTFRGSVVALDAGTGARIWKTFTIPQQPRPTKLNAAGVQMFGPSGAAVWSAPTIDAERGALYVATGNSYSNPPADTSDSVLALDVKTGLMLWHRQATPNDAFIVGCVAGTSLNCPEDHGPDFDFGQSPILTRLADGRRLLVIGQKSGVVHALDPGRDGAFLWHTRVGKGGTLGGSQWGSAADGVRAYVAVSDVRFLGLRRLDPDEGGGLFGLDLEDGKIAFSVPPVPCGARVSCSPALSAAVTVVSGVVFSGGVSGVLRAYATDGRLLWEFDTSRDYDTVNGVPAHGGAMDGPGPVVVDDMLFVNSGYGLWGGRPGNVLLAFSVGEH
jgi:polyvinyl alcohol dehydrogenase (cytochrome)